MVYWPVRSSRAIGLQICPTELSFTPIYWAIQAPSYIKPVDWWVVRITQFAHIRSRHWQLNSISNLQPFHTLGRRSNTFIQLCTRILDQHSQCSNFKHDQFNGSPNPRIHNFNSSDPVYWPDLVNLISEFFEEIPKSMAGAASALFLLDIKGRVLVWRDYRGDVSAVQAERFFAKLMEKEVRCSTFHTIFCLFILSVDNL